MADIFISYAREDRDVIRPLAEHLARRGWTVWWDRHILAGKEYDEVIEREIAAARCVLVAWSKDSVGSRWVRAEADDGARRRVLIPISLDGVPPPLGFRNIQTVSFAGIEPGLESPAFRDLVESITDLLGRPEPKRDATPPRAPQSPGPDPDSQLSDDRKPARRPAGWLIAAAVVVVVAAVVGGYFLSRRSPGSTQAGNPTSTASPVAAAPAPAQPTTKTAVVDRSPERSGPQPNGREPASPPAGATQPPVLTAAAPADPAPPSDTAVYDFVHAVIAASASGDVDRIVSFYAERVDYYAMGTVGQNVIRKDKQAYYRRWPEVTLALAGDPQIQPGPVPGTKQVSFRCHYEVSSPSRNARAAGTMTEVLVVSGAEGALKIVDQKETTQPSRQ